MSLFQKGTVYPGNLFLCESLPGLFGVKERSEANYFGNENCK